MIARRRRVRVAASVLVVVVAAVLAGCRTDVDVLVDVRADGAGTVTVTVDLDAEAAAQLGDPKGIQLTDLTQAGWKVDGPTATDDGLRIVAVRPFADPDQLEAVLDEVGGSSSGTSPVFSDTSLRLEDRFAGSSTELRTRLTLTGEPAQFSDDALTATLGGLPLGRTPEELAALGAADPDAATLTFRVRMPVAVDESNGKVTARTATWTAPLTGGTATDRRLAATATDRRTGTLVLVGLGAVLVLLAVVALVVGLRRQHAASTDPAA